MTTALDQPAEAVAPTDDQTRPLHCFPGADFVALCGFVLKGPMLDPRGRDRCVECLRILREIREARS